jgi:hypothetical protein
MAGHVRGCANKVSTLPEPTDRGTAYGRGRVAKLLEDVAAPADELEDNGPTHRHSCLLHGRTLWTVQREEIQEQDADTSFG